MQKEAAQPAAHETETEAETSRERHGKKTETQTAEERHSRIVMQAAVHFAFAPPQRILH